MRVNPRLNHARVWGICFKRADGHPAVKRRMTRKEAMKEYLKRIKRASCCFMFVEPYSKAFLRSDTFRSIAHVGRPRNDKPIVDDDGNRRWLWRNGQGRDLLHRTDGPAVEFADGSKAWYANGKRHRDGGLPAVEYLSGYRAWYRHGRLYRDDGPVYENSWTGGERTDR